MLFFQVTLVGGYAYAHVLTRWLSPRSQAGVHMTLLVCALLFLPVIPADSWKPEPGGDPTWKIVWLLTASLGVPFFVLSATGPLLQRWFTYTHPGKSPYRLYVWSNIGSFLALGTYPFLVEPILTRSLQSRFWSAGLLVFALACGYCAFKLYQLHLSWPDRARREELTQPELAPSLGRRLLWLGLPATATLMLLATTNKLSQEIAVIPFLWILPLSLYMLTFILCFNSPRWYSRAWYGAAFLLGVAAICWLIYFGRHSPLLLQIVIYLIVFFVCAMVCHGEVARLKPGPSHLTAFYLFLALGGALGGILVALVAPLVFDYYFELHIGLMATALLAYAAHFADPEGLFYRGRPYWASAVFGLAFLGLAISLANDPQIRQKDTISKSRNFYGTLTVREQHKKFPTRHAYALLHGTTIHGLQMVRPGLAQKPTGYYGHSSGIAVALDSYSSQDNRRMGVIGLGIGTLSAYGTEGDYLRFYEIDPAVEAVARTRFTYLKDTAAKIDVVLGDARLSLETEDSQQFDMLVLDAFNSDAIPVHLLTREAFDTYLRHLKPDGVIGVHISNKYLDLRPVLFSVAAHTGLSVVLINNSGRSANWWEYRSTWVLLTKNQSFLNHPEILAAGSEYGQDISKFRLWTDEFAALFKVLKQRPAK